ncbi:unnamed protein product [Mytilus edulis]|uniref:Uncharacterized protein n=1 Tax=Mytilus edulis TaxID=6550 RepID=A0A8S3R3J0_MYTED|nr:unnamed protein product [Mytilus edulis]
MPNERNAIESSSLAMGKKRRTTSRTRGNRLQPEKNCKEKKRSEKWWQKYRRKLLISQVNKQMKADLEVWLDFLKQYNGVTVITDNEWVSKEKLELFTYTSGGPKAERDLTGSIDDVQNIVKGVADKYLATTKTHLIKLENIGNSELQQVEMTENGYKTFIKTLTELKKEKHDGSFVTRFMWLQDDMENLKECRQFNLKND